MKHLSSINPHDPASCINEVNFGVQQTFVGISFQSPLRTGTSENYLFKPWFPHPQNKGKNIYAAGLL